MHHLQRKHCTTNSGMDAPSQTVTMHHGQRSACTIRRGVFTFGETVLSFVLAQVETGLGIIPASMGREVFDLAELKIGCVIAMNADIKADVAKPEAFSQAEGK